MVGTVEIMVDTVQKAIDHIVEDLEKSRHSVCRLNRMVGNMNQEAGFSLSVDIDLRLYKDSTKNCFVLKLNSVRLADVFPLSKVVELGARCEELYTMSHEEVTKLMADSRVLKLDNI